MSALPTLGGANSYATSINDSGQVAGSADDQSGHNHAFRYQGGNMVDLGALAALTSVADRVFLSTAGQMTDLGVLDDAPISSSGAGLRVALRARPSASTAAARSSARPARPAESATRFSTRAA